MILREVREMAGISQESLGEMVGVTRQTIAAWERGDREPSVLQVGKLCKALHVPIDVMLGMQDDEDQVLLFRADAAEALSPELKQLYNRRAADYAEIERLAGAVPNLPTSRPMDEFDQYNVDKIAGETRDWLGVEDAPLGNVMALLEDKGLKMFRIPLPKEVSGFSAYNDQIGGAIFINRNHGTDRQYFTTLHELAHLIFHRRDYQKPMPTKAKDPREKIANRFAGALMLPRHIVENELRGFSGKWLPEPLLGDIKKRYWVSMRAILVRAEQCGVIPTRLMFQQLKALDNRYGKENEPEKYNLPDAEEPRRLYRLAFHALFQEKISASRAAEILDMPLHKVRTDLAEWLGEGSA